jgi:hypothetical protein
MSFYMAVRGTAIVKLSIALRHKTTKPDYRVTYSKFLGLLEDERRLPSKAKEKDFGWAADQRLINITRLRADHHHRISFFLTSFPTSSISHHLQRCPSSERGRTVLNPMVSHRLLCSPVLEETRLVSCKTCQNIRLQMPEYTLLPPISMLPSRIHIQKPLMHIVGL